jgi:hypothetical protein
MSRSGSVPDVQREARKKVARRKGADQIAR